MFVGLYTEDRHGTLTFLKCGLSMESGRNVMVGDIVVYAGNEYQVVRRKWTSAEEGSLLLIVEPYPISGVVLA